WLMLRRRKRRYGYAFRKIPLTQCKYAMVDDEDYERLTKYKWFAMRSRRGFYAIRMVKAKNGSRKKIRMHRQIFDVPGDKFVDHINHNSLDNRKANLRIVTNMQNSWNKRKQRGDYSSQYKGVSWAKRVGKWHTEIYCRGTRIFIGYFDNQISAGRAYDAKAAELYGDYAVLNFGANTG
ncbi:MAG: HNH endonuclease, partial [Planctomycetota bacterium]